jgi:hypothetical protein
MDSAHRIKKSHFDSAIKSLNMLFKKHAAEKKRRKKSAVFAAVAGVLVLAFFGYYSMFAKKNETIAGVKNTLERMENSTKAATAAPTVTAPQITEPDLPAIDNTPPAAQTATGTAPLTPVGTNSGSAAVFEENAVSIVSIPALNIRSAPQIEARRVGTLWEGDTVMIKEETAFWVRIELADGTVGWVYKQYLRLPGI